MNFRFYKNALSQATRGVATVIFVAGLVLIGFGFLIYLLPRLFATLAAVVFFVVGVGCLTTGVKIFWAQRKIDKIASDDSGYYGGDIEVHVKEDFDS